MTCSQALPLEGVVVIALDADVLPHSYRSSCALSEQLRLSCQRCNCHLHLGAAHNLGRCYGGSL